MFMQNMVRKIKNQDGLMFSWFEGSLLTGIIVMVLVFGVIIGKIVLDDQKKGDDNLRENNALSIALVESNNGSNCPLDGNSGMCIHHTRDGYVSYYDDISNTLVADKPMGYNSYHLMKIGETHYYGRPKTMVLVVVCKDQTVSVRWEEGSHVGE